MLIEIIHKVEKINMTNQNWSTCSQLWFKLHFYREPTLKLDYSNSKVNSNLNFLFKTEKGWYDPCNSAGKLFLGLIAL